MLYCSILLLHFNSFNLSFSLPVSLNIKLLYRQRKGLHLYLLPSRLDNCIYLDLPSGHISIIV